MAFQPICVDEGVYTVAAQLNGVWVNLYILRGDRLVVVDTGYCNHPEAVIIPALESLGLAASGIDLIVNTHGHPDHLGGNSRLRSASGAKVLIHHRDAHLSGGAVAHERSKTDHISAMREMGWSDEVATRSQFLRSRVEPCAVDRELFGEEVISVGRGLDFRVIETFGHSEGSVSLYIESKRLALTGDAVQCQGTGAGVLPLYYDPERYMESLDKLEKLALDTLCLGHDFVYTGGTARLDAGAVRRGVNVKTSILDSMRFALSLKELVASIGPCATLQETVLQVARKLPSPYSQMVTSGGRFSASSAATIISQIRQLYPEVFDD